MPSSLPRRGLYVVAYIRPGRSARPKPCLVPFAYPAGSNVLGINPAALDALVLSHGHYDHFGGVVGFLQKAEGKLKPELPLYIGGEECFCACEWVGPPVSGNFGVLDRRALEQAKLMVTYAEGPSLIGDHAFSTGEIGLRSFERVLSPSTMQIGFGDGIGCYPRKLPQESRLRDKQYYKGTVFRGPHASALSPICTGELLRSPIQPSPLTPTRFIG